MNVRIPSAFLAMVAAMAFSAVSRGADNSAEVVDDAFVDPPPALSPAPIPNESGVIFRDGKAYLLHRLQADLSLPNGTTVAPDGRVTGFDGTSHLMQSGQILSLDGQVQQLPANAEQPFSTSSLIPGSTSETSTQDFFAPASGSFPGTTDSAKPTAPEELPDTGDFSD